MPCLVVNSSVFGDMFGTTRMRSLFTDRAFVQRCLDVEAALARAQGKLGLIPAPAAAALSEVANVDRIDLDTLSQRTQIVGYPKQPNLEKLYPWPKDRRGP